jgi:hypothetical protein
MRAMRSPRRKKRTPPSLLRAVEGVDVGVEPGAVAVVEARQPAE